MVVRSLIFEGSAMSAYRDLGEHAGASSTDAVRAAARTPEVEGSGERGGCACPRCVVGRAEVPDYTACMGVRVNEWVGCLYDLLRHVY